jgi:hypothetical protein
MAASANSIKKAMKLREGPKDGLAVGEVEMIIRIQRKPNGLAYVDGRPCGYGFRTNPATTAQGVMETVAATVTEFMKAAEKA